MNKKCQNKNYHKKKNHPEANQKANSKKELQIINLKL